MASDQDCMLGDTCSVSKHLSWLWCHKSCPHGGWKHCPALLLTESLYHWSSMGSSVVRTKSSNTSLLTVPSWMYTSSTPHVLITPIADTLLPPLPPYAANGQLESYLSNHNHNDVSCYVDHNLPHPAIQICSSLGSPFQQQILHVSPHFIGVLPFWASGG